MTHKNILLFKEERKTLRNGEILLYTEVAADF